MGANFVAISALKHPMRLAKLLRTRRTLVSYGHLVTHIYITIPTDCISIVCRVYTVALFILFTYRPSALAAAN